RSTARRLARRSRSPCSRRGSMRALGGFWAISYSRSGPLVNFCFASVGSFPASFGRRRGAPVLHHRANAPNPSPDAFGVFARPAIGGSRYLVVEPGLGRFEHPAHVLARRPREGPVVRRSAQRRIKFETTAASDPRLLVLVLCDPRSQLAVLVAQVPSQP